MRRIEILLSLLVLSLLPGASLAAGVASHVVVIVWDGMRPDFVREETTPNLAKLAREGVTFRRHHPVYLSSTEVNAAALATGCYPSQNGIVGNQEFRPAINRSKKIMTATPAVIRKGDALSGDHFLTRSTLAEILQGHGLRTAVAGSKPVAILQDRAARSDTAPNMTIYEGATLPTAASNRLVAALGAFPPAEKPRTQRDRWTTQALIGSLWAKGVPAFSLLWLSEPDASQHGTGPGSPTSLAALQGLDQNLELVLTALKEKQVLPLTDIILVSDHGFSTIYQTNDIAAVLTRNGFRAYREVPAEGAHTGDVLVVGNGGSIFFYVVNHEKKMTTLLAQFLQTQPFTGVLFTRNRLPGAFRLKDGRLDSAFAPDIVLALRWLPDKNTNGVPGLIFADAEEYVAGHGMHVTLSPFDMHNTCIAVGPDFRRGFEDEVPSGNVDLAPTILWIFGLEPPQKQAGRVLQEAMVHFTDPLPSTKFHRREATYRAQNFVWRQYLNYCEVLGTIYFEEGNGEMSPTLR